mmetsp:Transcript_6303/g.20731  ORF Transcript_6303/g.20731 Transcript_6303/m.20731 type:complete len:253 (+) Transcript_6303:437-1195(+)|eukprot:scaffold14029_cov121-Isochrysis_galbana.AAC.8
MRSTAELRTRGGQCGQRNLTQGSGSLLGTVEGHFVPCACGALCEARPVVIGIRVDGRAQRVHRLGVLRGGDGAAGALFGRDGRRRTAKVSRLVRLGRVSVPLTPLGEGELGAWRITPDHSRGVLGRVNAEGLPAELPPEDLFGGARAERETGAVDQVRRAIALAQHLHLVRKRPPVHLGHVPPVDRAQGLLWRRRVASAFVGVRQAAKGRLKLGVDRWRAPIRPARFARTAALSDGARLAAGVAAPFWPEAR